VIRNFDLVTEPSAISEQRGNASASIAAMPSKRFIDGIDNRILFGDWAHRGNLLRA
jgi:hypothetical protein